MAADKFRSRPSRAAAWWVVVATSARAQLYGREALSALGADGQSGALALSILGTVINVTDARHLYGEGAPYASLTGRDASRAFATGDFDGDLHDGVADLSDKELADIVWWSNYLESKYEAVGRLAGGAFFDEAGEATDHRRRIIRRAERLRPSLARGEGDAREEMLLPCEAKTIDGGRRRTVSCSAPARLPREREDEAGACVCVHPTRLEAHPGLRTFGTCGADARVCTYQLPEVPASTHDELRR